MTILYDDHIFTYQKYGGISRYFYELITGVPQENNMWVKLPFIISNNTYLKAANYKRWLYVYSKSGYVGRKKWLRNFNHQQSIRAISKQQYDIFHPTYYDEYFLKYIGNKPFVLTIHDMIHERLGVEYPELGGDTTVIAAKRTLAQKAKRIIAVSNATKKDIVELLNIPEEKIDVIYHGYSFSVEGISQQVQKENYLLIVGNRGLYKNFLPYLAAIADVLKKDKLKLICAGGGGASAAEKNAISALGLENQVTFIPINDDSTLKNLYSSALAFVFPSKYEGFGIPVLEAFACGCPCLLANATALPEVAGDGAHYFSPFDAEDMRAKTIELIENEVLRTALVANGFSQLLKFSWQKTLAQTVDTYRRCLE